MRVLASPEGSMRMMRGSLSNRMAGPAVVLAVGGAMFALVLALRLSVTLPGFAFTLLFAIPVAVVAVALGVRAGIGAAVLGLALVAVCDATAPIHQHGMTIHTNAFGYASWALLFFLLGGLLGAYSDRVRRVAEQFQGLVEAAPDAMVIVGERGRIKLANVQATALLGYTGAELLGLSIEALVPERFRSQHVLHRGGFFAGPHARVMGAGLELYALRKDGREIPVEVSLGPLQTDQGTLVSAALRDVSDRKRAEEELEAALARERDAAERLRDLDRLKDEFLATVSHELRTPLTVIMALAEVLNASALIDERRQADLLGRISNNAGQMNAMIAQLLDYSRLEAGKVALEVGPLPLRDAVMQCIELVRDPIGARPTLIEVPADLTVQADKRGFERILVNLLSNAAKYSPEGSAIRVSATTDNGDATVAVQDEGIGIPAAEQSRGFERFYQGSSVPAKRGTGVGLSIVRRYVELLGGQVWVESDPGRGSRFQFRLPTAGGTE